MFNVRSAVCLLAIMAAAPSSDPPSWDDDEVLPDPEHCFRTSPEAVLEQLSRVRGGPCETCIDSVYEVYASRVRPLVDARCPNAVAARDEVRESIVQFDRAFQSVTSGNWFGHESSRHDALVEWVLISLERDAGRNTPRYSDDDLRAVMLMWHRARRIDEFAPLPTEAQFMSTVDLGLDALSRAEKRLTPDRAALLRLLLLRKIARWL